MTRAKKPAAKAVNLAPVFASYGIPEPEREVQFAAGEGRRFAVDYGWPAIKLGVEIDGGIYGRGEPCPICGRRPVGAHTSIERLRTDQEKSNLAVRLGWAILHYRPEQVRSGQAFVETAEAFRARLGEGA